MPNWVINKARISGAEQDINSFIETVRSTQSDFDFNKIIPEPDYMEECDPKYYRTERSGVQEDKDRPWFNWYDWHCDFWGTKWGACEVCVNRVSKTDVVLDFQTAWSFPEPIWIRLTEMFPRLRFEVDFADEDLGYNCGSFYADETDEGYWMDEPPIGCEMKFACDVWGFDYAYIADWFGDEVAKKIFGED